MWQAVATIATFSPLLAFILLYILWKRFGLEERTAALAL